LVDDARSHISATPRRYDVIVSEPSNPWRAGVANLFTEDFYLSARGVLRKGGIFGQWVQLYFLESSSLKMIFRTFHRVFPEVQVWWLDRGNLLGLGSESALPIRRARAEAMLDGPFREERLRWSGLGTSPEFFGRFVLGTPEVEAFIADGTALHTDDRPLLEFQAPRGLFAANTLNGVKLLNLKVLSGRLAPTLLDVPPRADEAWLAIAEMYRQAEDPADAAEATRRALASSASPLALLRSAAQDLDAAHPDAAEVFLRQVPPAGALPRDVARER